MEILGHYQTVTNKLWVNHVIHQSGNFSLCVCSVIFGTWSLVGIIIHWFKTGCCLVPKIRSQSITEQHIFPLLSWDYDRVQRDGLEDYQLYFKISSYNTHFVCKGSLSLSLSRFLFVCFLRGGSHFFSVFGFLCFHPYDHLDRELWLTFLVDLYLHLLQNPFDHLLHIPIPIV